MAGFITEYMRANMFPSILVIDYVKIALNLYPLLDEDTLALCAKIPEILTRHAPFFPKGKALDWKLFFNGDPTIPTKCIDAATLEVMEFCGTNAIVNGISCDTPAAYQSTTLHNNKKYFTSLVNERKSIQSEDFSNICFQGYAVDMDVLQKKQAEFCKTWKVYLKHRLAYESPIPEYRPEARATADAHSVMERISPYVLAESIRNTNLVNVDSFYDEQFEQEDFQEEVHPVARYYKK
jgi:hypothetical protein